MDKTASTTKSKRYRFEMSEVRCALDRNTQAGGNGRLSPSMLTLVLLYGLLILQSAFYFFGLTWSRSATLTFYSVTALWTLGCAWTMRRTWQRSHRFNRIDVCFVAFGFMIAVSLGASSLTSGVDQRLWGFLLFMVVVPYACGRCLVSVTDLHKMQALVLIAGLAVMPMLLADRLMMPAIEYGRTAFFGMDHSPLMVGALLAATLICVHSWVLCPGLSPHGRGRVLKIAGYTLLFLTTVCLVWSLHTCQDAPLIYFDFVKPAVRLQKVPEYSAELFNSSNHFVLIEEV